MTSIIKRKYRHYYHSHYHIIDNLLYHVIIDDIYIFLIYQNYLDKIVDVIHNGLCDYE